VTQTIDKVADVEKFSLLEAEVRDQASRIGGSYPHLIATLETSLPRLPDLYPDLAKRFPEQAAALKRLDVDREQALRDYMEGREWPNYLGPIPGARGCRAPEKVIARVIFGGSRE
jgi:hypothetical protein